jgi:hypothetical protein
VVIRHNDIVIDRKSLTISVGYRSYAFKLSHNGYLRNTCIVFESICFILLKGWVSKPELFEHIYGQCAKGGPDHGIYIFDIHLNQWKKHYAALGLCLMRDKRGGIIHFALEQVG